MCGLAGVSEAQLPTMRVGLSGNFPEPRFGPISMLKRYQAPARAAEKDRPWALTSLQQRLVKTGLWCDRLLAYR